MNLDIELLPEKFFAVCIRICPFRRHNNRVEQIRTADIEVLLPSFAVFLQIFRFPKRDISTEFFVISVQSIIRLSQGYAEIF